MSKRRTRRWIRQARTTILERRQLPVPLPPGHRADDLDDWFQLCLWIDEHSQMHVYSPSVPGELRHLLEDSLEVQAACQRWEAQQLMPLMFNRWWRTRENWRERIARLREIQSQDERP